MKLLLTALFLAFLCISSSFPQETDVTIYFFERMPFGGQVNEENKGILIEITKKIFDNAQISYHFELLPVARIFEILKKSDANVCFPGVFRNPERDKQYIFSDLPIYQDSAPHYVIRKKDEQYFSNINTIHELLKSNKKVGLVEKFSYGIWVDDNIKKDKPNSVIVNIGDDQKSFYKMLLANRFDYFFASTEEANYIIRSNPAFSNTLLLKNLIDAPEGNIRWIIFNKTFQPELLERINRSIVSIKASEQYKIIIEQSKK
jgi:polar amino acid transport system substrate-binding protein